MISQATDKTPNTCHGCQSRGWVSVNGIHAVLCPVCNGSGVYVKPYPLPTYPPQTPFYTSPTIVPRNPYPAEFTCGSGGEFTIPKDPSVMSWNKTDEQKENKND